MGEDKPFTGAPDSRVHAMCVQYHMGRAGNMERGSRFFLFMKNDCLLKYVEDFKRECTMENSSKESGRQYREGEIRISERNPPRKVPWEEWGPDNTRFMPYGMQFRWLRYVHGQKVVCPPYTAGQGLDRVSVLEVLDFNIHVKRLPENIGVGTISCRGDQETVPDKFALYVYTDPSPVEKPEIFLKPVVSRLPYSRAIRTHVGEMYSGFMIDEERIVGLRSDSTPEGEMGDIDVFTF